MSRDAPTAKPQGPPGVLVWRFSDDYRVLEAEREQHSGWRPENLRRGFRPATVVDVGCADGTPPLYAAFPDAYHVLIDPLSEYEGRMREWLTRFRGEYLLKAVGSHEGAANINVDPERLALSSMLEAPAAPPEASFALRTVEIATLDSLLRSQGWSAPFGLKIDAEGFEDEVVRGAESLLRQTEFVIAEVNVGRRGSYSFADFIGLMDASGFRAWDFLDGWKGRPTGMVAWVDVLFRRK